MIEHSGKHLLVELNGCDGGLINDLGFVKTILVNGASEGGVTILNEIFHEFSPVGVTGVITIPDSHISIHTCPEPEYTAVDIFSWSEAYRPHEAARLIVEQLGADSHIIQVIERGIVAQVTTTI